MKGEYPKYYEELQGLVNNLWTNLPGPLSGFSELHKSALADSALSRKHKELIALGIAIAARCKGCIAYHVHDALKSGATRKEVIETIGVAIFMGGGPAMIYGTEAIKALDEFQGDGEG